MSEVTTWGITNYPTGWTGGRPIYFLAYLDSQSYTWTNAQATLLQVFTAGGTAAWVGLLTTPTASSGWADIDDFKVPATSGGVVNRILLVSADPGFDLATSYVVAYIDGVTGLGVNPSSSTDQVKFTWPEGPDYVWTTAGAVGVPTASWSPPGYPTAHYERTYTGGRSFTLDASASTPGDDPPITEYRWIIARFPDPDENVTTYVPSLTFTDTGSGDPVPFDVQLNVVNNIGTVSSDYITSGEAYDPLVASISGPFTATPGSTSSFGLGGATTTIGSTYLWTFSDDSSTATTGSVSHTWASSGTFLVSLTVYDTFNRSTTVSQSVTVGSAIPPVINLTPSGDQTIETGDSIAWAANATDADGTIASYAWTFEAGAPSSSTASTQTVTYSDGDGPWRSSVVVTDNDGNAAVAAADIFLAEVAPTARRSVRYVTENEVPFRYDEWGRDYDSLYGSGQVHDGDRFWSLLIPGDPDNNLLVKQSACGYATEMVEVGIPPSTFGVHGLSKRRGAAFLLGGISSVSPSHPTYGSMRSHPSVYRINLSGATDLVPFAPDRGVDTSIYLTLRPAWFPSENACLIAWGDASGEYANKVTKHSFTTGVDTPYSPASLWLNSPWSGLTSGWRIRSVSVGPSHLGAIAVGSPNVTTTPSAYGVLLFDTTTGAGLHFITVPRTSAPLAAAQDLQFDNVDGSLWVLWKTFDPERWGRRALMSRFDVSTPTSPILLQTFRVDNDTGGSGADNLDLFQLDVGAAPVCPPVGSSGGKWHVGKIAW